MLLLDENISFRLVKKLDRTFPGTTHVGSVLTNGTSDTLVRKFAAEHNLIVVTKDKDHVEAFSRESPCSIVLITLPNCSSDDIEALLVEYSRNIMEIWNSIPPCYLRLPLPVKQDMVKNFKEP